MASKAFIDLIVIIILKDKSKAKVISFFYDRTFLFTYNMKIILPDKFSDSMLIYINNFQEYTSMRIEVQINSQIFKPKKSNEYTCKFLFKSMKIYKI